MLAGCRYTIEPTDGEISLFVWTGRRVLPSGEKKVGVCCSNKVPAGNLKGGSIHPSKAQERIGGVLSSHLPTQLLTSLPEIAPDNHILGLYYTNLDILAIGVTRAYGKMVRAVQVPLPLGCLVVPPREGDVRGRLAQTPTRLSNNTISFSPLCPTLASPLRHSS